MGGQVRFGPDTEFIDKVDYTVDPNRAPWFYDAARLFRDANANEWEIECLLRRGEL